MAGKEINFSSLRIMSETERLRARRDKKGKREVDGERRVRRRVPQSQKALHVTLCNSQQREEGLQNKTERRTEEADDGLVPAAAGRDCSWTAVALMHRSNMQRERADSPDPSPRPRPSVG